MRPLLMVLLVLLAVAGAAWPAAPDEPASHVGTAICAGCHSAQADLWKGSNHARAMQPANQQTVLGDFSGVELEHLGVTTRFFRSGERFMVRTEGPDGAQHDYAIAYTFGVDPLQQYLIAFPDGRYQALGIAWDTRPKAAGGQRWYHLYPDRRLTAGETLHWTGRDQTWNYMCADCHSTDVRRNYDLSANSYATTFSDMNVGCEACHGAGSRHVAWATTRQAGTALPADLRKGLIAWLDAAGRGTWEMNQQTGIARRSEPGRPTAELNACGTCHTRRKIIATGNTPATPLLDASMPALLEPGLYHADGQIDGEVFEVGSFLQSRMAAAGVTCTNCHEPHGGRVRAADNSLCAQCHLPQKFDVAEHHHHSPGSQGAQCVACHMPVKTYMGVHVRHDHSFRVPRPDLTQALGMPNSCNSCHTGKSAEWAAKAVAAWFPHGRQDSPHYATALQAGRAGVVEAEARLDGLILDPSAPAIARATALSLLPRVATPASRQAVTAAIADPDPMVRMAVPRALPAELSTVMIRAVAPLLSDPVRAVRIETARALAGADLRGMAAEQRQAFDAAIRELVSAEMVDAERPEAHLNLGLLDTRLGRASEAEVRYRTALRLDAAFVPAMVNLADLERARGNDQQGADLLRKALALEPNNAGVRHSLGLALVRQRRYAEALEQLRRASELAPDNSRYGYVLAVALNSTGKPAEALAVLRRVNHVAPADRDILAALVSLEREQGDIAAALQHAQALLALDPNDVRIRILVESLTRARSH